MKKEDLTNFKKYYLNEFEYYDGECFIPFNIVGIDTVHNEIRKNGVRPKIRS